MAVRGNNRVAPASSRVLHGTYLRLPSRALGSLREQQPIVTGLVDQQTRKDRTNAYPETSAYGRFRTLPVKSRATLTPGKIGLKSLITFV
jgi:hypothetical protein